ncbi:palmitoyltransferase ZDHHC12-B-like [Tubulanus polymorphus]|uniref:palmitoyltransferase ZDHHC12-B-like n=1 Tax=Tubulanus polymorphus TaxID=672921 RepID=UPI003DA68313
MSFSSYKEMSKFDPYLAGVVKDYRPYCKVIVRGFHTFLTIAIPTSLIVTKTEIYAMYYNAESSVNILCFTFTWFVSLLTYHMTYIIGPGFVSLDEQKNFDDSNCSDLNIQIDPENNKTVFRKCGFCGVQQPLRARHCEDCGRCVRKFDHHCPWFDACIGEFNHKHFLVFLISTIVLMFWCFTATWHALQSSDTWRQWLVSNHVLLFDLFWLVVGHLIMIPLAFGHFYLMTVNATTWEFVGRERIRYLKHLHFATNPFDEGCRRNVFDFLCRRRRGKRWERVYMRKVGSFEIV